MSGKPIKMNDLITVCFTPLDPTLSRVALLTRQVGFSQHLYAGLGMSVIAGAVQ